MLIENTKKFGGLPWDLFFTEKPEFTNEKGYVLNCKLESTRTEFKNVQGETVFTTGTNFFIDDVEIELISKTEKGDGTIASIPWNYIETKEEGLKIYPRAIWEYLQRKILILLPCWINVLKENRIENVKIISDFLQDSFSQKNNKNIRNSAIKRINRIIPIDEYGKYGDIFNFFENQEVIKKVERNRYILKKHYTPEEFNYLMKEAYQYGYIDYRIYGKELSSFIYKNSYNKTFYSLNTWKKKFVEIREEEGKFKPPFLKEIFEKNKKKK